MFALITRMAFLPFFLAASSLECSCWPFVVCIEIWLCGWYKFDGSGWLVLSLGSHGGVVSSAAFAAIALAMAKMARAVQPLADVLKAY